MARTRYDNALAEAIDGLYRAEVIHRQSWRNREAVEMATLNWVRWFNHHRLLGPIGNIPPAEAEAAYYRQQAAAVQGGVTPNQTASGKSELTPRSWTNFKGFHEEVQN